MERRFGSFVLKVCNILLRELWDKGIDMFTIWLTFPEYGSNVGKRNKHAKHCPCIFVKYCGLLKI